MYVYLHIFNFYLSKQIKQIKYISKTCIRINIDFHIRINTTNLIIYC